MDLNGIEIPDKKIIERARELGYIKMPTEEWLCAQMDVLSPDYIGDRYILIVAERLHARLSETAAIPQPSSA